MNYVRLLAGKSKGERVTRACLREAAQAVIELWSNEGIPIIKMHNVVRKLKLVCDRYHRLNKTPMKKRNTRTKQILTEEKVFRELFDIASCRCKDLRRCNCPLSNRVPAPEAAFLRDQRGARKMKLGTGSRPIRLIQPSGSSRHQWIPNGYR